MFKRHSSAQIDKLSINFIPLCVHKPQSSASSINIEIKCKLSFEYTINAFLLFIYSNSSEMKIKKIDHTAASLVVFNFSLSVIFISVSIYCAQFNICTS